MLSVSPIAFLAAPLLALVACSDGADGQAAAPDAETKDRAPMAQEYAEAEEAAAMELETVQGSGQIAASLEDDGTTFTPNLAACGLRALDNDAAWEAAIGGLAMEPKTAGEEPRMLRVWSKTAAQASSDGAVLLAEAEGPAWIEAALSEEEMTRAMLDQGAVRVRVQGEDVECQRVTAETAGAPGEREEIDEEAAAKAEPAEQASEEL